MFIERRRWIGQGWDVNLILNTVGFLEHLKESVLVAAVSRQKLPLGPAWGAVEQGKGGKI